LSSLDPETWSSSGAGEGGGARTLPIRQRAQRPSGGLPGNLQPQVLQLALAAMLVIVEAGTFNYT